MTKFETKHYVTFESPGTMFAESSSKEMGEWDTCAAMRLCADVRERHGARPYAFYFSTRRTAEPVVDDDGNALRVESKELKRSGKYYVLARLRDYDEVVRDNLPDENILRSNMLCNGYWVLAETTNSYKHCAPFNEDDFVVDADGRVTHRGDEPELVKYRADKTAQRKAESSW